MANPDLSAGLGDLSGLLNPLFDSARGLENVLVPTGLTFLSMAIVFEISMTMLQFWVKGGAQELMSKMVRLVVVTSIPFLALTTWPDLPNKLINFFQTEVSSVFTHANGDAMSQVSDTIDKLFNAAWSKATPATKDTAGAAAGSTSSGWLGDIKGEMTAFVIQLLIFLPMVIFTICLLFALYGPMLMIYIGLIFGPILIAWLPWEPLSHLATKWLSFMITMGLSFAVGLLLATLEILSLNTFAQTINNMDGVGDTMMAAVAGVFPQIAVFLFLGFMLLKTEHIAASLVGGPNIGGGAGFFAMAAGMAMKGMGKKGGSDKKDSNAGGAGGTGAGTGGTGGNNGGASSGGAGGAGAGAGANLSAGAASASGGAGGGAATSSGGTAALSAGAANQHGGAGAGGGGSSAPATFAQRMSAVGQGIKKAATSKPAKALAVSAAAMANPVAGVAVGAMVMSPKLRETVSSASGAVKGAVSSPPAGVTAGHGSASTSDRVAPASPAVQPQGPAPSNEILF